MSLSNEKNTANGSTPATSNCGDRVDTPNPNDVLCGRGGNINSHRGNEQFRSFVEKRKRVYLTARFKREKRLIASSIVNEIRAMDPPGRFLARKGSMKDDNGYWYDIGDEKARDKTSQALRENAPSIRAEIETEINQQRAEMRRQETVTDQTLSSSKAAGNDPSYPSSPHGHGPVHHGQQHGNHPPPPPPPTHLGHTYNPVNQSHYTQQYYDCYYHYYGYGAPPPPPPPGYAGSAGPDAHPAGYPPAPHPYWVGGQTSPKHPPQNTDANEATPAVASSSGHKNDSTIIAATNGKAPAMGMNHEMGRKPTIDTTISQHSPHATHHTDHNSHQLTMTMQKQEEEDRRLAMALQQEENAKAFEERNRRFGSDRRSSRSTAYCAPGYRPRLLNDSIDASNLNYGSSPSRKKRPAMSASHFFPKASNNTDNGNTHANMEDDFEMDLKPKALVTKEEDKNTKGDTFDNHHTHDFSCSSFSSRGRLHFKDDSDIMSLFGEGDNIIPSSNANSTGSFHRVRNTFAAGHSSKSNNGNHHFNPIAMDQVERNHQHHQRNQQRNGGSRRDYDNHTQNQQQQNNQDSSLLSQVAQHILGNFGVGVGGSSWTESDAKQSDLNHNEENTENEMEMEMGQEVIMDVRDESSSMPPPHARGSGTQIDWASRAGCHSWIPDAIGYTSSSHFGDHDNNRDQHTNYDQGHHHANDHSLMHQTSYSRTDISPINSMDMDFSRSSNHGGRQRTSVKRNGLDSSAHTSSSLMNLFDKKDDDPDSILHQVPSWERSYRSRSPVSIGELSAVDGIDNSLIRVNSHNVKDKLFGIVGKNTEANSRGHQNGHQSRHQNHHHQSPMKLSAVRSNHDMHQNNENQETSNGRSQNFDRSRSIDMDWD